MADFSYYTNNRKGYTSLLILSVSGGFMGAITLLQGAAQIVMLITLAATTLGVVWMHCMSGEFISRIEHDHDVENQLEMERRQLASRIHELEYNLIKIANFKCYSDGGEDNHHVATVCARIGRHGVGADNEVVVLATLNNTPNWLSEEDFAYLCGMVTSLATNGCSARGNMFGVACIRRNVAPERLTGVNAARYEELADLNGGMKNG